MKKHLTKIMANNESVGITDRGITLGILKEEIRVYKESEIIGSISIRKGLNTSVKTWVRSSILGTVVMVTYKGEHPTAYTHYNGEFIEVGTYSYRGGIYPSIFEEGEYVFIYNKRFNEVIVVRKDDLEEKRYGLWEPYYRVGSSLKMLNTEEIRVSGFGIVQRGFIGAKSYKVLVYRCHFDVVDGQRRTWAMGTTAQAQQRGAEAKIQCVIGSLNVRDVSWFGRHLGKLDEVRWIK